MSEYTENKYEAADEPITCEACNIREAGGHYYINMTGVYLCDDCLKNTGKTGEE